MGISDYITSTLGSLATYVGWSVGDEYYATDQVLRIYGVTTESEAVDLGKLYAICDMVMYKRILNELATKFNFSADGASYSYNQVFQSVKLLYENSITDGIQYLPTYTVQLGKITNSDDPYGLDSFSRATLGTV